MSIDINFPVNLVGKLKTYTDISYVMSIPLLNLVGKLEWRFKPWDDNFPTKFNGETELLYRSRDVNFPVKFSGEFHGWRDGFC